MWWSSDLARNLDWAYAMSPTGYRGVARVRVRDDDDGLGERVRILRTQRRLSQLQLGTLCHVSRTSIANIEGGRQQPTVATLKALATALETTAGVLIGTEPMEGDSQLPKVVVVTQFLVHCELCGWVEEPLSDASEAEALRRRHHVPHYAPGELAEPP